MKKGGESDDVIVYQKYRLYLPNYKMRNFCKFIIWKWAIAL